MHLGKLMAAGLLVLAVAGCASASFKPYDKYDTTTAGIRIPERKPLVVLMGNTVSIQWVCNNDRGQAMQFSSFLAKHHMKVDFDGCGGIDTLDSEQDSTAIPLELIKIINGVAQNAFGAGTGTSGTTTNNDGNLAFQIFDVRFGYDGTVELQPLVKPGYILRIDTGTGKVSGQVPVASAGGGVPTPPIAGL
jgi:hypothetical protein